MNQPRWFKRPESKDYVAARTYLSLVASDDVAKMIARKLKRAGSKGVVKYRANDILRSSLLMFNDWDAVMVKNDLRKIKQGKRLSPVLLVTIRDAFETPLIIADGFHRVLTCHELDPKFELPCVHVTVNLSDLTTH